MNHLAHYLRLLLCCLLLAGAGMTMAAQTRTLSGRVVDTRGEAVIGAGVIVPGGTAGTVTEVDGSFHLRIPNGDVVVEVSALGYASATLRVDKGQETLLVVLEESALQMDEIIVVGYGEQTRRSITGAVAKLGGESVQDIPISTLGEGLKGKIAGLRVVQTDNTPGGSFSYTVRGGSSINGSNTPLVLVDGVERDFSTLNPNDIASIEVLKDAASSAIYGSRASNGIILVTTKRGGYNRAPRITFETGIAYENTETEIEFLGAEDYIRVTREAVGEYLSVPSLASKAKDYLIGATSAGTGNKPGGMYSTRYFDPETETLPKGYQTMQDPLDPSKTIMFKETDWQHLMYRPAIWQNYYVGVDGGSERIRYKASMGYTSDGGVAISTGYNRASLKTNLDVKVTQKLTANFGVEYARTNTENYANQRNTISRSLANPPTMNAYYDDGTPVEGYNSTSQTPLFYNAYYDRNNIKNYLSLIGGLTWEITPGLKGHLQGSFFHQDAKQTQFIKANVFDASRKSSWSQTMTEREKIDAYLDWKKTLARDHNLSLMAGYSWQNRFYETVSVAGTGGTSDKVTTLNGSSTFDPEDISSSITKEVNIGFFGRLNYDYKGRYLFTGTFREDGSSKFAAAHRWGFFPGASAGWVISEEPWFKSVKAIPFLKVRASYGSTGNSGGVGVYDAYGAYGASYIYNGNAGLKPTDMPNENLMWETTTQLDLGFEAGLFGNRIYISADYYDKMTDHLLYEQNLPNTTGFSKIWTNLGKVRFWGYELELTTHNIQKRDFNWDTKLTLSYNKNVVVKLPDNGIEKGRTNGIALGDGTFFGGIAEGEPLYRFYGPVAIGILQNEDEAANAYYDALSRLPAKGMKRPGDYEWKDRNGDGQITTADQFELGVTVPPLTGGLNNDFRWKNLTVSVYLDWAVGHSIFDDSYSRYFYSTYTCNYALAKEVLKCWKQEGDKTRFAKFTANDSAWGNDNFNRAQTGSFSVFTYKGDYLCLREVSLRYVLPEKLLRKTSVKGLELSLSGNNLYYLTAVKGISPEIGTSSTYSSSYNNYPPIRRISAGAKLTF